MTAFLSMSSKQARSYYANNTPFRRYNTTHILSTNKEGLVWMEPQREGVINLIYVTYGRLGTSISDVNKIF